MQKIENGVVTSDKNKRNLQQIHVYCEFYMGDIEPIVKDYAKYEIKLTVDEYLPDRN